MKIRSLTISLLVLIVFSMNLISCGALPQSPTLTPPPTQTSTPTAAPTITATPTLAYPVIDDATLQKFSLTLNDVKVVWQDQDGKWFAGEKDGDKKLSLNEEDKWVLVVESTEAGTAAIALFNEIGIDPATYELKMDGQDVVGIDKETGNEIFRNVFDLHDLVPLLPVENLPRTNIEPLNMPYRLDPPNFPSDYFKELVQNILALDIFPDQQFVLHGLLLHNFEADGKNGYAWGFVLVDNLGRVGPYLAFYDLSQEIHIAPIKPISNDELFNFYPQKAK